MDQTQGSDIESSSVTVGRRPLDAAVIHGDGRNGLWYAANAVRFMNNFGKTVRVVLFLQAALFLFKSVAYWIGIDLPGVSGGGAISRRVTALDCGFAVLLFLAGRRLSQEPRWIHPVLAMVVLNWLESGYELFALGDRAFAPPLVVESVLGALYAAYAISLARSERRAAR